MTLVIAWDTETALIRPGVCAPELACVQVSTLDPQREHYDPSQAPTYPATVLEAQDGLDALEGWLRDGNTLFVGAHVAFDFAVAMQNRPSLIPLVFQAYWENRVTDIQTRQKLLDIAAGCYRGEIKGHRFVKYLYSLADVTRRLLRWNLSKPKIVDGVNTTPDHWRLRYGELIGVPIEQWPAGAIEYAKDDARATLGCWYVQEAHSAFLDDQYRQARRFLAATLTSNWGLRTHLHKVEEFMRSVDEDFSDLERELKGLGLVKPDGVRDTKAAARYMISVCQEKKLPIVLTDTGVEKLDELVKSGVDKDQAIQWFVSQGQYIALDADTCAKTDDSVMTKYAEFGVLKAVIAKDGKMLREGSRFPVHTRFDIVETGRTSSSGPNVQNLRTLVGIRECFVPREGWVFGQGDYPGLELKTLAQSCIWLLGGSVLAQVINSGKDPHLMLAATIAHMTYEQAEACYKADKNWKPRRLAKVANFGFPGGLGAKTFIEYAAGKPYLIQLTKDEAYALKEQWLSTWVEMRDYFALISQMVEAGDGKTVILHPRSNRYRGGVYYTSACNGYFQGLGADATGEAWAELARAMYDHTQGSILYGCRTVNYVHDEFIVEIPDDARASDRVKEMCRIMRDVANRWLPDVPFTEIEPCLMSHWSKDAKTLIDKDGNVQVWRG